VLFAALGLLACTTARHEDEAAPTGAPVQPTPASPKPEPVEPALVDPESETGPEPATETESETGTEPEAASARLCSQPYSLSSTPGKGSQTVQQFAEQSDADRSAATRELAAGFEVRVDEREREAWTSKVGAAFDGLDPSVEHRVEIFNARGKRIRRLTLDFDKRGSDDLCLAFNSFYATWQLQTLPSGRKCGPCVTR